MEMFRPSPPKTKTISSTKSSPQGDFLTHLELFLSKRDGLDKLLKILRYASKIILSSSLFGSNNPFAQNLTSFDSSIDLSRKAFRLGKFIQDINAFRTSNFHSRQELLLSVLAYFGEGLYYLVEQFVWVGKCGVISEHHLNKLQGLSGWFEVVGYIGSVSLRVMELKEMRSDEKCLVSSIEVGELREIDCREELERLRVVREEKLMKRCSIVQDLANGLVVLAYLGGGRLSPPPLLVAAAGLLSALISAHQNWVSTRFTNTNSTS